MNVKKLTSWNMTKPIDKRLHLETIVALTEVYRMRGDVAAMRATIQREIAPALAAKRKADDLLERTLRDTHEKQGYSVSTGDKYNGALYTIGGTIEPHLASVNDSFHSVRTSAMESARVNTLASDNSVNQAAQ